MKTEDYKGDAMRALHALVRYQTHGGYAWAAVMFDGELMCVPCVRANFRQVYKATRDHARDGWAVQGIANSGDSEETEYCCHCNKEVWTHDNRLHWQAGSGRALYLRITLEDAQSGSHQGACDDDVQALSRRADIAEQTAQWDSATLAAELKEYGAWDATELADHDQNIQRMLWLACGDITENPESYS